MSTHLLDVYMTTESESSTHAEAAFKTVRGVGYQLL